MKNEKYSVYWKCFISFGIFILLYIIGILLPIEATPHYHNYMSRIWNWTEILVLLLALYYIIKTKSFHWKQAVIAMLLGTICLVSLLRDPRTADIIITSVCVMVTFYAACRLYELADIENISIHTGITKSIWYFCLGAVIAIPLAFLNILYFSLSHQINIRNILSSAAFALKPAIAEEVIFRFFLLAYACCQLYGKVEKRFFNIYIYTLMIIPHELLHYPDLFIESPGLAVVMCILNGLLFGLPMALLMKRKNLQMAIGMHWFIDFARFVAGF
jgi:hypothetical protein